MLCSMEIHKSSLSSKIYIRLRNKIHQNADATCCVNQLGEELTLVQPSPQMTTYTNNKSLHNSANTTSQISDRRLHVCYQRNERKMESKLTMHKQKTGDCRLSLQEGSIMH